MNKAGSASSLSQRLRQSKKAKEKKSIPDTIIASGGFLFAFGLLLLMAGVLCFAEFKNPFSRMLVDVGGLLSLMGFMLKMVDMCMRILGRRS